MRRRIWVFIVQVDLLLAEKCGLPRLIDERQTDAMDPQNLLDQDFEDCEVHSPSARPLSEPTTVSYVTYKMKTLRLQSRILDHMDGPKPISYGKVLEWDRDLSDVAATRPVWLTPHDHAGSETDWHSIVFQGIEVDLILNHARMVLHREYLIPARSQPIYSHSRTACLEAAWGVLRHQHTLYRLETESGSGTSVWRFLLIANHEFLLAAMILCLDLNHDLRASAEGFVITTEQKSEALQSLKWLHQSHLIWNTMQGHGEAVKKAASIVGAMVDRVRHFESLATTMSRPSDLSAPGCADDTSVQVLPNHFEDRQDWILESPSLARKSQNWIDASLQPGDLHETDTTDPARYDVGELNTMFDDTETGINWAAWDAKFPETLFAY